MAHKPKNLIYGLRDRPPLVVSLVMGLQHVFLMTSTLVLPIVIVREIGGTFDAVRSVVCFSMIAAGIGTILQATRLGPVGSGYLCPNLCGPSYLSVSMQAAWLGGMPLMRGMTVLAGLFEALFSRLVRRLRSLFPTEVTGLVVLMVGVSLIPLGASKFLGIQYEGDLIDPKSLAVAALTLSAMIGINIWGRGKLRLYCVLIGMGIGYLSAAALGVLSAPDFERLADAPLIALPGRGAVPFRFSFDGSLLLPFLIVSLCGSLKSFGNLITCQKINDDGWKRPDMGNISRGLLADAASVVAAGLLGGMATDTSSSNVGLSAATGATSRRIAYSAGAIFVLLGFLPKAAALISIMPAPVMGAILIFVTSFMVIAGIQILLTRMMDNRKIFAIGISFIFGLSVDILPGLYAHLPYLLRPIFASSLTLSTVMAIVLSRLFRIGVAKSETLLLKPGADVEGEISAFLTANGEAWGARQEVVQRAVFALTEAVHPLVAGKPEPGDIEIRLGFNELSLDVDISCAAGPFPSSEEGPPPAERYADAARAWRKGDLHGLHLHFDH